MRIPDTITKAIGFLCFKILDGPLANTYKAFATGLIVGVYYPERQMLFTHLVVAKHSISEIQKRGIETLFVRLNTHEGGSDYVEFNLRTSGFMMSVNESIDLATMPIGIDYTKFDVKPLDVEVFATENVIRDQWIGLGDDLFVPSLFVARTGNQRNIPIIRTGIIASMPDEPIKDGEFEYNAFLAELRSIGGISGSPVFVYLDKNRAVPTLLPHNQQSTFYLLGLICGHWNLGQKQQLQHSDISLEEGSQFDIPIGYNKGETLNVGIAIITPAQEIFDLVMSDKFEELRQSVMNKTTSAETIVEDSDFFVSSDAEEPISEADAFIDNLKRASRRISAPVAEKKETSD
jgi:hypothetical protein